MNSEIIKYAVLILTAPFWWPFIKALYREIDNSLADQGGIFGGPPTEPKNLTDEDGEVYASPLVSQPREGMLSQNPAEAAASPRPRGPSAPGRGFRN